MSADRPPYPPPDALAAALQDALAQRSLDALLGAVSRFVVQFPDPNPDNPMYRPAPGIHTLPQDLPEIARLTPEESGAWFHMMLYNAGNVCYRAGELHLALECYKQALLGFDHPGVYNNISAVLDLLGRFQEANTWLQRAVQLNPYYPQTWLNLLTIALTRDLDGPAPETYVQGYRDAGGSPSYAAHFLQMLSPEDRLRIEPYLRAAFPE